MIYRLFIKRHVRKVYIAETASHSAALAFFDANEFAYAIDSNNKHYETKEELKNAENIRSTTGDQLDYESVAFGEVFEDTDRELSGTDPDNSESGPECDN